MLIIPAIDIIDGEVSRLTKGDFKSVIKYSGSVLDYAKLYESIGIEWLHVVDLKASVTGNITCFDIIKEIKENTNLKIEFGGGIKSITNAEKLIDIGVDRLIIGSISITNKTEFEKIANYYDSSKIVVAVDTLDEKISVKGWTELSSVNIFNHIEYCQSLGIKYYLCTDISKDGMLGGVNISLYKKIQKQFPDIYLIASGGVSNINDIKLINKANMYAVVVGKAIYENKISLEELKSFVK
ncbi:MAG: 1-(5-phosphoribosyl)-5-[(5-phosphoribosylamino)methylideneamino]imidazole-4-carboxamide isomerase [bacterium]